jgi:ABC transport system ATP-binding/permease protein
VTIPAADRRCDGCGARIGANDRACFACHRSLAPAPSAMAVDPVVPPDLFTAESVEAARRDHPWQREASIAATPPSALTLEIRYGRARQTAEIPLTGATIGSAEGADIRVPAAFLRPVHARVEAGADGWTLRPAGAGAIVTHQGVAEPRFLLSAGEIYRVADGVGNFITVRPLIGKQDRTQHAALRAALPERGMSFLIGSDPSCAARLDHPLVQRRHAAVRRDEAGELWLEDRATAAGTYVNGHRLRGRTRLAVGDILQIGPFSATVGRSALEPIEQMPGVDIDVLAAGITVKHDGQDKALLRSVTLHLEPASLTAVIGPSGAGKTTLMRMLSGQLATTEGLVTYNGIDLAQCRQSYAELMGFVPQDDVVHADLTIAEALDYQARLRLGTSTTPDDRQLRITELVTMLGLSAQYEQLVRTLSGGQRKRVSIACELLKEPQLLFLDEPTSGLDPGLDKRMLLLLRLLADQGRTVLITTHSIAHVNVCDTLILLGPGGHLMYGGNPDAAAEWFGVPSLGDVFSLTETPELAAEAAARRAVDVHTVVDRAARVLPGVSGHPQGPRLQVGSPAWRAAVLAHTRIFGGRQARLIGRDRTALAYTLLQGVVVALLTAFVAPKPFTWSVNGSSVTFVFGCAAVWFGMISSVREIVKERPIWRREFMAGGNLVSYLAAKVTVLSAVAFVQALTLTAVLGMTLGLPASGPLGATSVTFTITLWLANVCGIATGLLVSATSPSADRALSLVPYLLIAQLILCGVLFRLGAMTFVSWFMPARWAVSSLGGIAGLDPGALHQSSGLYPHSGIGLAANWLALVLIAAGGIAGTSWSLVRQGRSWQIGSDAAPPIVRAALARAREVIRASSGGGAPRG